MNSNSSKLLQLTLSSLGNWLILIAIVSLLGAIGLGWLVKSFFIVLGLILIAPIVAVFVLRWWLSRNVVQDRCPVCNYEFAGLVTAQLQCPSCGEPLQIQKGHFERLTPDGTIDVNAVEVSAKAIED